MSAERAEQPAVPANVDIPGKVLAAQREAMGWTVEQVADQLKLAVRQIVALEAGDYASLPSAAVVRGFVRAYAKVVKLDPAPLVAQIALETPGPGDATAQTVRRDKPTSFSEVRFPTHGKRTSLPLGLIGGVLALAALAAAAWHFGLIPGVLPGGASTAATQDGAAVPANVTVLPAPIMGAAIPKPAHGNGVLSGHDLKALQSTSVPLISVPPPATVSAGAPAAGVAPAAAAVAAPVSANALVLNVREDSWIEVRPAKGAPLISRLVRGGSTETLNITEPVSLTVGKPDVVEATLRGATVALPTLAGRTVAKVNLQ